MLHCSVLAFCFLRTTISLHSTILIPKWKARPLLFGIKLPTAISIEVVKTTLVPGILEIETDSGARQGATLTLYDVSITMTCSIFETTYMSTQERARVPRARETRTVATVGVTIDHSGGRTPAGLSCQIRHAFLNSLRLEVGPSRATDNLCGSAKLNNTDMMDIPDQRRCQ